MFWQFRDNSDEFMWTIDSEVSGWQWMLTSFMNSDHSRAAPMYVDYGGETHTGMGIKSMKSSGRPKGRTSAFSPKTRD